jgi:hypothetical protein
MPGRAVAQLEQVLYHFELFGRHASHPFFSDPGNNIFSIFENYQKCGKVTCWPNNSKWCSKSNLKDLKLEIRPCVTRLSYWPLSDDYNHAFCHLLTSAAVIVPPGFVRARSANTSFCRSFFRSAFT